MFINEFFRRLPQLLKLGIIYSCIDEMEGNSLDLLEDGHGITFHLKYKDIENVSVKAEVFDSEYKEQYLNFITKIGYKNLKEAKIYKIKKINT